MRIVSFLILILLISNTISARAEVLRYVDRSGRKHYVDSLEKVPEQYRSQLKDAKPLPRITKVESFYLKGRSTTDANAQSQKVNIYVTAWCPYCKKLEALLKKERVKFNRYDIDRDPSARKRYKELGGKGVPFTTVGNQVIRGYSPDQILAAAR